MGEMILARWECGHEVKQVCTEVPGENGIGECPYCRLEAVKQFASHKQDCDSRWHYSDDQGKCDCGLDKALGVGEYG